MFCPACGFEYTQKTNYCKRCGENLGVPAVGESPKAPRLNIAVMACAVAAFGSLGLLFLFAMYQSLWRGGARGDELILPFMLGITFVGAIAGLLVWQLSRLISIYQRMNQNAVVERHIIREVPQAQLGKTADQASQPAEYPSVVEHTTRQFAKVPKEMNAPK